MKIRLITRLLLFVSGLLVLSIACGFSISYSTNPTPSVKPSSKPTSTPLATRIISPTSTQKPSITPILQPTNTELPPLPDFEERIIFAAFGAGVGDHCRSFELPPAPSAVGGTTFPVSRPTHNLEFGVIEEGHFSREARLCILGVPLDQPISISLVSADRKTRLSVEIILKVEKRSVGPGEVINVYRVGDYKEFIGGGYQDNQEDPIEVVLNLWWAGGLASRVWDIVVTWPDNNILGKFYANTRRLPEISLFAPEYKSLLFPSLTPGVCHVANIAMPYKVLVENFPKNKTLYVLVYSMFRDMGNGGFEARLEHKVVVKADEQGNAVAELPFEFTSGDRYYIIGVPEGITSITWGDDYAYESGKNTLSSDKIANAIDCFIVP